LTVSAARRVFSALLAVVAVLLLEQLLAYTAGYHPLSRRPSTA
jgi:hypothetical protein